MNDDLRSRFRAMADRVESQVDAAAAWHSRTDHNRPSGLLVASAAAFTIMVAIGGVMAIRTIGVGPTDTTSPTLTVTTIVTDSIPVSPVETSEPATSTTTTATTAVPPSIIIYPPPTHVVADETTVEMRSADGAELLANLAAGTSVYYGHESTRSADGRVLWLVAAAEPIEWFGPPIPPDQQGSLMGWVDPEHLRSISTYQAVAACALPGTIERMESSGGEALPGVVSVTGYELIDLGGCRRLVIAFSEPVTPLWQSDANPPAIRILLSGVSGVEPAAGSHRWTDGSLFAVREPDGSVSLELDLGDAAVDVRQSADARHLLVEFAPNPQPIGFYSSPVITDSLVLRTPPISAPGAIALPEPRPYVIYEGEQILVNGFATAGQVDIRVLDAGGTPRVATYERVVQPGAGTEARVLSTAADGMWGRWLFYLADLPPGEYQIELSTEADTIVTPFTVLGIP